MPYQVRMNEYPEEQLSIYVTAAVRQPGPGQDL